VTFDLLQVDHNTRTTTFKDPRSSAAEGVYGVPVAYERSFKWKIMQFRLVNKLLFLSSVLADL
jgi:hypothetical protein